MSKSFGDDLACIGLIAIPYCTSPEASDASPKPMKYDPYSIPNAIRTVVPEENHTYATATFSTVTPSSCTLHHFPTPSVFVVD